MIGEDEIDEEAVEEELEEDLLSIGDEDEIGLSDEPAVEEEIAERRDRRRRMPTRRSPEAPCAARETPNRGNPMARFPFAR